ncbi:MAG TPA: DoxX family protein [Dongiaceae bacterium]|nr:DoxX family protein [Dongiaceae bacterium]
MVALFVIFGWQKLTGYDGTIAYFTQAGVPLPSLAAPIAVIMELGVGIAIALGLLTRPLAILLALYTLATASSGITSGPCQARTSSRPRSTSSRTSASFPACCFCS